MISSWTSRCTLSQQTMYGLIVADGLNQRVCPRVHIISVGSASLDLNQSDYVSTAVPPAQLLMF